MRIHISNTIAVDTIAENATNNAANAHLDQSNKQCSRFTKPPLRKGKKYNKIRRAPGTFECKICGKYYSNISNLRFHLRRYHTLKQIYNCDECGQQFTYKKQLSTHRATHFNTDASQNQCSKCTRTFTTKSYLLEHQRKIHTETFKCDKCEMVFNVKADLLEHRSVHIDMQLSCEYCGRKYWKLSSLLAHQRFFHLDMKPFTCGDCGKRYAYECQLKIHQIIHSSNREQPYECWMCHRK